jgi:hypothetical protein
MAVTADVGVDVDVDVQISGINIHFLQWKTSDLKLFSE